MKWFRSLFKKEDDPAEDYLEIQQPETRIEYLVRELIKELQIEGKDISYHNKDAGSIDTISAGFDIDIWNLGQPNEFIRVRHILNDWKMDFRR